MVYYYDDDHREGQHTIVTETQGPLMSTAATRGPGDVSGADVTGPAGRTGLGTAASGVAPGRAPAGKAAPGIDRTREPTPASGAVSLWLDTYEDIFSDFDPRPYGQRALSEDFLAEAKRAVRDRRDDVPELRFLVPTHARNLNDETTIRKRLRDHFRKHADRLARERRRAVWGSLAVAAAGFAVMTASALLRRQPETVARTVLHVLLEPAGWFAVWFGLDELFYGTRELAREHAFYRKMARADVAFSAYSEEGQTKASASERDQAE